MNTSRSLGIKNIVERTHFAFFSVAGYCFVIKASLGRQEAAVPVVLKLTHDLSIVLPCPHIEFQFLTILRCLQEIDSLVTAQEGGELITLREFVDKFSTPVQDLAAIAKHRFLSLYPRQGSRGGHARERVETGATGHAQVDPDQFAARLAVGLVMAPAPERTPVAGERGSQV
jgi:hypothetical protein